MKADNFHIVPRYLTIPMAAKYANISESTIQRMIRAGQLSAPRFLSDRRVDRWSIDKWAAGQRAAQSSSVGTRAQRGGIRRKSVILVSPV